MNKEYQERFLRSIGIMSLEQLARIKNTSIAVGGLGLGGSIFINLVRMGFEKFHIADPDIYERTNINRQRAARETSIGLRKDDCLMREALEINPDLEIRAFPQGVNSENVKDFLSGIDWVVDVVDVFAIPEKLALNAEAARQGIPLASSGSVGFAASVVVFDHTTPSFADLTGMSVDLSDDENMDRFVRFICPEVPAYMEDQLARALKRESHIPFVVPGVELAAAFVVSEISKQILGIGEQVRAPLGIHIDPVHLRLDRYVASHQALGSPAQMPRKRVA